MVDVGYFIDGRHGVIKAVKFDKNDISNHLVFSNDDNEQYALYAENIEYIIPHEEEYKVNVGDVCKSYTEEQMIELCQSVDKPLTNAEKFKEVFGLEPDRSEVAEVCDMVDCRYISCQNCPHYNKGHWDDKWEKPNDTK